MDTVIKVLGYVVKRFLDLVLGGVYGDLGVFIHESLVVELFLAQSAACPTHYSFKFIDIIMNVLFMISPKLL